MNMKRILAAVALAVSGFLLPPGASAQITNTVFYEDFSSTLDPNKIVPDAPAFEGGKGTIEAQLVAGMVEFTGVVTEQWWAGSTLRVVPTFTASAETNVVASVDRVSELGTGTGHRSAMWIMDVTGTYYVFFAYNSENNWQYNRKIGQSGDVPTGGGNAIAAFNAADGPFLDNGQHEMKAVANGKTVKLYLDNVLGAEVAFPFSELVFQIGSYARANNDVADSIFDNLKVQTVGASAFSANSLTLVSGQTSTNIVVRVPPGVNNTSAVQIRVKSSDPTVAIPEGAVGDTLTLNLPRRRRQRAGADREVPRPRGRGQFHPGQRHRQWRRSTPWAWWSSKAPAFASATSSPDRPSTPPSGPRATKPSKPASAPSQHRKAAAA